MAIEQKRIEEMCAYLIDHLKVTDLGILMTWQDWQINFPATAEVVRHIATGAASAAFPELASDPPTGWVAPMEATERMLDVGVDAFADPCWRENVAEGWRMMRDAHIKEQT